MRYPLLLALGASLLVVGCENRRANQPAEAPSSAAGRPEPDASTSAAPADTLAQPGRSPLLKPGQLGYHRYVGTLGAEPVIVELTTRVIDIPNPYVECQGRCYNVRTGEVRYLELDGLFRPDQPLRLRGEGGTAQRQWRAEQPLGPVLMGSCSRASGSQPLPFRLREDYAGAVRYELLEETLAERPGLNYHGDSASAIVVGAYLHLLGPDTLRPALARLQCPRPAQRLRARRALAAELTPRAEDMAMVNGQSITVTLNEADLLAYYEGLIEQVVGAHRYESSGTHELLDLRTGQPLDVTAQLRPGQLEELRRRITRQALADTAAYAREYWLEKGQMPLPPDDFSVTPAGWEAQYGPDVNDDPEKSFTWHITWAELEPLLRPESPLQRLVQLRTAQAAAPRR